MSATEHATDPLRAIPRGIPVAPRPVEAETVRPARPCPPARASSRWRRIALTAWMVVGLGVSTGEAAGLRAYWTTNAVHAARLGQIDWADYDQATVEPDVNWPNTSDAFYEGGPTDYFALRLVGLIDIPESGDWSFSIGSDEGARLWIDGTLVVNDDASHSFRYTDGSISLSAGPHDFELRYLERRYSAGLVAQWKRPGDLAASVIPSSAFSPGTLAPVGGAGGTGVRVYWSTGVTHAVRLGQIDWDSYSRTTDERNVSWRVTSGALYAGGPIDYVAARVLARITIPRTGLWTFSVGSDEGARLLIDDRLVVNDDASHSFRWSSGAVSLAAGEHDFEIRYLECRYSAGLVATFQGPGDPYESVIPSSSLTPRTLDPPRPPPGSGLQAYWTHDTTHATRLGHIDWDSYDHTTTESKISWYVTSGSFYVGGPSDYFALRLLAKVNIPMGGQWFFNLGSDEGAQLLIDDVLVIDDDASHAFRWKDGTISLAPGEHELEVRYLELRYSAGLVLTWKGPGDEHESIIPAQVMTPRVLVPVDPEGSGLRAYWSTNVSHAARLGHIDWYRYDTDTIEDNVNWTPTSGAFSPDGPADYFALRLVGTLDIPEEGEWTLSVGSDEGARLWIDGVLLTNDGEPHAFRWTSGTVTLTAGAHDFELRYLERRYSAGLVATWYGPGLSCESVIPSSAFTPAELVSSGDPGPGGLRAYWSLNATHASVLGQIDWIEYDNATVEPKLSWRTTSGAFYLGGPTDYFALRLVGEIEIPESGQWAFSLGADEGCRLWIDNQLVVNDDASHSFRWTSGTVSLSAGKHDFEVRFLERRYSAALFATWRGPSAAYEEVIPARAFTPADVEPSGDCECEGLVAEWFLGTQAAASLDEVDWSSYDYTAAGGNVSWEMTSGVFFLDGPTDYFALRLAGQLNVPQTGLWTFSLGSDEGARLLIDDTLVVNDDASHSFRWNSGGILLTAGLHEFEINYMERRYTAGLMATWKGPGDVYESVIPCRAFGPSELCAWTVRWVESP